MTSLSTFIPPPLIRLWKAGRLAVSLVVLGDNQGFFAVTLMKDTNR
jgi:hypothetical protein